MRYWQGGAEEAACIFYNHNQLLTHWFSLQHHCRAAIELWMQLIVRSLGLWGTDGVWVKHPRLRILVQHVGLPHRARLYPRDHVLNVLMRFANHQNMSWASMKDVITTRVYDALRCLRDWRWTRMLMTVTEMVRESWLWASPRQSLLLVTSKLALSLQHYTNNLSNHYCWSCWKAIKVNDWFIFL